MRFDGNDYGEVRVNVVSWLPTESAGLGLVRTRWDIETLSEISEAGLQGLAEASFDQISPEMAFDVEVSGPRTLSMTCTCEEAMADPSRLGVASVAWRLIDENISRIWMIGNSPRFVYPEFMRQRRQLVGGLSASHRRLWVWFSLVRSVPVLAVLAGMPSSAERILSALWQSDAHESDLADYFLSLSAHVDAGIGCRASADLGLKDVRRLWAGAVEAAVSGSTVDSVDLVSYATERVLDVLCVLDRTFGKLSLNGLASVEDIAWFEDVKGLGEMGQSAWPSILDRCRSRFSEVEEFCSRPEVRLALGNIAN